MEHNDIQIRRFGDHIVEVALSRPERRNALTVEFLEQLSLAIDQVIEEPDVRAILLTGEGPTFCAGADREAVHNPDRPKGSEAGLGAARIWDQLAAIPVPVIAVVQGHAIAGGLHLALCCDLTVAAEDALLQDTHARLGLVPGSGEPQRYSRLLGISIARELLFTSRPVTGAEAERRGIVAAAVPVSQLHTAALELASQIVENSSRAVRYMKRMLNDGYGRPYGEAQWDDLLLNHRGRLNMEPDPDRDERLREFGAKRRLERAL